MATELRRGPRRGLLHNRLRLLRRAAVERVRVGPFFLGS